MKKLKVGGVGSRDYKHLEFVQQFADALPDSRVILVSGGARGVDHAFAGSSKNWRGKETIVIKPEVRADCTREEYRKAAYGRNRTIARTADVLVAFWDGSSGGTANTVTHAAAAGRPVYIIGAHREGFDEALAAVLGLVYRLDKPAPDAETAERDARIGTLIRAMPCGHSIRRLPSIEQGRHGKSEFTIYNRQGDVVAFSEDPVAAFLSAFGRYSKELYQRDHQEQPSSHHG